MNIPIKIELPQVWEGTFVKDEWNPINYIVGPNGTGMPVRTKRTFLQPHKILLYSIILQ
ncbi:MAG: hypothetical protein IKN94_07890 [Salinivirgaceae bacterium]|nr:hypothetical protein [Salinivirgaceae bacterium]